MEFVNDATNEKAPVPWSKEHAIAIGYSRYVTAGEICPHCKADPVARYVDCGTCVQCAVKDSREVWSLWTMGSPDRPTPFPTNLPQALTQGVDYFYRDILCKGGVHFVQPHIKTGKCVACAKLKTKAAPELPADMVLNYDDAVALGFNTYRTGEPCRRGHRGWRYVSNKGCIQCMRSPTVSPLAFEIIKELETITVEQQAVLFLGYAYDGRRMIDPDGRKWNATQFNSMLRGPASYERTHGRKPVTWPYDAFISNFGPGRNG